MNDRELKKYLQQSLRQEVEPDRNFSRWDETVKLCMEITRKQAAYPKEQRTSFLEFLSDVFRFEGIQIFGLQGMVLFFVCMSISTIANIPENIPSFMPLFALAVMPVLFQSQYYGMSEMEAVTRVSGSQIILAKLILSGAANLVCMTVLLGLELYLQNSCENLRQMILYILVPYLVCMVIMLRFLRMCRKEGVQICTAVLLCFCVFWGMSAKMLPWLYEVSAMGIWVFAFLIFAAFFIKEVGFIIRIGKDGKMYGIIA